jgi:hypothetical protein
MTVKLIPRRLSHDTVETFSEAAEESKSGEIIGSVIGLMYRDLTVRIGNTGELYNNPMFARCIVAEMDDYLSEQTK